MDIFAFYMTKDISVMNVNIIVTCDVCIFEIRHGDISPRKEQEPQNMVTRDMGFSQN